MDKTIAADSLEVNEPHRTMRFGCSTEGIVMEITEPLFARLVYRWVDVFGKLPQIDAPDCPLVVEPEADE